MCFTCEERPLLLIPVFREQIIKGYLWYVDLNMIGLVINKLVLVKKVLQTGSGLKSMKVRLHSELD